MVVVSSSPAILGPVLVPGFAKNDTALCSVSRAQMIAISKSSRPGGGASARPENADKRIFAQSNVPRQPWTRLELSEDNFWIRMGEVKSGRNCGISMSAKASAHPQHEGREAVTIHGFLNFEIFPAV